VQPTCHYMMGGIPTNLDGQVLNGRNGVVHGLFAAGESACVSVHGANRLGCNSLLDLVVYGRRAGRRMMEDLRDMGWGKLPERSDGMALERIQSLKARKKGERASTLRREMQEAMTHYCSVFRDKAGLTEAQRIMASLVERSVQTFLHDRGERFNRDLLDALELDSLLGLAQVNLASALARQESRGAHFREDFPERDDKGWLKHTLVQKTSEGHKIFYKPVTITRFEPKPRTY
jgi:succinate dehydrogenase / fumarate reductase flavoprotein subunit